MYTVFDFETTGLLKAVGTDIMHQPHITEVYCLQFNEQYEEIKEFHTLVKPPIPIPLFLEKQIGITNEMVHNAPTFLEIYKQIIDAFLGTHTAIAHNLTFDEGVLIYELRRIGKEHHFPYPPNKFCTVEQSMWVRGHRLKNSELYKIATGNELEGAHQAKNDVLATFESFKWLRSQGI